MAWGGRDDDEDGAGHPRLREWHLWPACVLGSVTPTAVLTTVAQWVEGQSAPAFVPALYIGVFTIAVLIVRPWTVR